MVPRDIVNMHARCLVARGDPAPVAAPIHQQARAAPVEPRKRLRLPKPPKQRPARTGGGNLAGLRGIPCKVRRRHRHLADAFFRAACGIENMQDLALRGGEEFSVGTGFDALHHAPPRLEFATSETHRAIETASRRLAAEPIAQTIPHRVPGQFRGLFRRAIHHQHRSRCRHGEELRPLGVPRKVRDVVGAVDASRALHGARFRRAGKGSCRTAGRK